MYQIQLVWNREFHWSNYSKPYEDLEKAKKTANELINSGDGARVKKVQILDENDKIVWKR